MPIKEACSFIPKDADMNNAYYVVNQLHEGIVRRYPDVDFNDLRESAGDFFTAGVAFHANRGFDRHMGEVGESTWWLVNQQQTLVALTNNMVGLLCKWDCQNNMLWKTTAITKSRMFYFQPNE